MKGARLAIAFLHSDECLERICREPGLHFAYCYLLSQAIVHIAKRRKIVYECPRVLRNIIIKQSFLRLSLAYHRITESIAGTLRVALSESKLTFSERMH